VKGIGAGISGGVVAGIPSKQPGDANEGSWPGANGETVVTWSTHAHFLGVATTQALLMLP
jgi:hypothetical protein